MISSSHSPALPIASISDAERLNLLRNICFTPQDLRAGWFGPGIPHTSNTEFLALAKWASEHWYMYAGFIEKDMPRHLTDSKILDIGCGIGHATMNLATLYPNCKITALDNDTEAIIFAKDHNSAKNIRYIAEDFFTFRTEEKYDYIFALEVYEHLPALLHDLFIEKCLNLLTDEGILFLTTPNGMNEKDAAYGHIGFLNRKRARIFAQKYRNNIVTHSFINNKKLLTGRPDDFIIYGPMERFEENAETKSHFRLVMKKNMQIPLPPINAQWQRKYTIYAYYARIALLPKKGLATLKRWVANIIKWAQTGKTREDKKAPLNWHEDFIVQLARVYRPEVYVELGLYRCALFNRIIPYAQTLIGVDTVPEAGRAMSASNKATFYCGKTDDFAKHLQQEPLAIDMLFIDADHSKEAVKKDFHNFFPFVSPHGLIIMHDSHPKDKDQMQSGYCGDGYQAIGELARHCDEYEMVTIPVHPGLTICRKRRQQLKWQEIEQDQ